MRLVSDGIHEGAGQRGVIIAYECNDLFYLL